MQFGQRHPLLLRLVLGLALAALIAPAAAAAWTWPAPGPVLQGFAFDETDPLRPGQHRGIDIAGPLGAQVLAPTAGTVTFVGKVAANGLTVTIQTPDGYVVTLLHLGSALVARGAVVVEGQPVALVGSSGVPQHAEPYVQLGVRLATDPLGYVDPEAFLPPLPSVSSGEPPQPQPGADPAAGTPPAPVPPPAAVPPSPTGSPRPSRVLRRTVEPASAPDRAAPTGDPARTAVPSPLYAPSPQLSRSGRPSAAVPAAPRVGGIAALDVRPADLELSALPLTRVVPSTHGPNPDGAPTTTSAWLRLPDPFLAPARVTRAVSAGGSTLPWPALPGMALAAALALGLCGRRFWRRPARIIGGDALLPDDADLLREREPAHRARVHDDRRRRARPAPQAAR